MWPGEHEELTVWADRLLADGHPLGQLVALGLRVEQLRLTGSDPTAVEQLDEELADLIERNAEALLGPIASEPAIELEWQFGVVRALTIVSRPYRRWSELRDGFAELVRQPAMRFVDHLHFARPLGWRITNPDGPEAELGLLELLAHPSSLVRPRRIVLGPMPKRFRLLRALNERPRMSKLDDRQEQRVRKLLERGLTWLIHDQVNVALPWTRGNAGTRVRALEQLLASAWTPQHTPLLARALWDPSMAVRRRVIEAIPTLPDEAAPLLLPLLAINVDGHRLFGDLVARAVAHTATRPAWVHAVAQNYRACEPWVTTWLESISAS